MYECSMLSYDCVTLYNKSFRILFITICSNLLSIVWYDINHIILHDIEFYIIV